MKKYRVMTISYGYTEIDAENEASALEKCRNMSRSDFDWSDPDDEQIVEEIG